MLHRARTPRGAELLPCDPRITPIQRAAADRVQRQWQAEGQPAIARAQLPDGLLRLRSAVRAVLIHPDGQVLPDTTSGRQGR
jgi:hypothetical protein